MGQALATRELAHQGLSPALLWLVGPGHLDEFNPQEALIFDAGQGMLTREPLAQFYAIDIWLLDWLNDYLMNQEITDIVNDKEDFENMFTAEQAEEEEIYSKNDLTTIESDSGWADT